MEFAFTGDIWYWRGPAPFYFMSVPEDICEIIKVNSGFLSYGWGMIPVRARIGGTDWKTAMWPKDGGYILPVKVAIRRAEELSEGDVAEVQLWVGEAA